MGQRAAIYARVSTADQCCERQVGELTAFAERGGFEVLGIFKETASGARNNRLVPNRVLELAQRLPVSGDTVLAAMRRRALTPTVRLWAIRAPFESKELLRARGYRWMPEMRDGIERSW